MRVTYVNVKFPSSPIKKAGKINFNVFYLTQYIQRISFQHVIKSLTIHEIVYIFT